MCQKIWAGAPPSLIWTTCTTFFWTPICQKIWPGVSSSLPIPKLTQYIQFVKSGQTIWARPVPNHLDKIPKDSYFFFGRSSLRVKWTLLEHPMFVCIFLLWIPRCWCFAGPSKYQGNQRCREGFQFFIIVHTMGCSYGPIFINLEKN